MAQTATGLLSMYAAVISWTSSGFEALTMSPSTPSATSSSQCSAATSCCFNHCSSLACFPAIVEQVNGV